MWLSQIDWTAVAYIALVIVTAYYAWSNYKISKESQKSREATQCLAESSKESLKLLLRLRESGIKSDMDFLSRSLKAQLKEANKFGAEYVLIIGPDELEKGIIKVKKMDESVETEFKFNDIMNKSNLLFQ